MTPSIYSLSIGTFLRVSQVRVLDGMKLKIQAQHILGKPCGEASSAATQLGGSATTRQRMEFTRGK